MELRFVLNRPRSSQNIGAAARALANTGAGALWVVEPLGFDRAQAAKLAAGADEILERMRVVRTLDEALGDCLDVVMTTGRTVAAPPEPQADERLLSLLRDRARALLLASGFLNPQQPDLVLDELVSLLRRARPARREVELLLAAIAQLERTRR